MFKLSIVEQLDTVSTINPSKVVSHLHDHTLAGLINGEPSNLNAVPSLDCLDERRLPDNLDQLLAVVALLEQLPDVA